MEALSVRDPLLVANEALGLVNRQLEEEGRAYSIKILNQEIAGKSPLHLQLVYTDGGKIRIGVTHLAHLEGANWDDKKYEEVARSTQEVADAMLRRIVLFLECQAAGKYFINSAGTIYDLKNSDIHDIEIDSEGIKIPGGHVLSYDGEIVKGGQLVSSGILKFVSVEGEEDTAQIQEVDGEDHREGKGMFFKLSDGAIFRG